MTDERKNEIWNNLPDNIKGELQYEYIRALDACDVDPRNDRIQAHILFMEKYFGKENLYEQAENTNNTKTSDYSTEICTNSTKNGTKSEKLQSIDADNADLNPPKSVGLNEKLSNSFQSFTDWNKYRLDLAKEIAVAMIRNTYITDEFVENIATAANLANEIVKRLKETEE